jgi:hypothetical protein
MNTTDNPLQNPLPGFEQRLLDELRDVATERATKRPTVSATGPQPPARRITGRTRLVVGAAAAAVIGAVLAIGVPLLAGDDGAPSAAAYTVEPGEDGKITVTIKRLEDAEGLKRQLAEHGVRAQVAYSPPGKGCADSWFPLSKHILYSLDMPFPETPEIPDGEKITFRPAELGDRTLVIHTSDSVSEAEPPPGVEKDYDLVSAGMFSDSTGKETYVNVDIGVADGPVGPCPVIDLPR